MQASHEQHPHTSTAVVPRTRALRKWSVALALLLPPLLAYIECAETAAFRKRLGMTLDGTSIIAVIPAFLRAVLPIAVVFVLVITVVRIYKEKDACRRRVLAVSRAKFAAMLVVVIVLYDLTQMLLPVCGSTAHFWLQW